MFTIVKNASLRSANTLGLDVNAFQYCCVKSVPELDQALNYARENGTRVVILGGGSNIVLTGDIQALVIKIDIRGVLFSGNRVTVAAGENWHEFVLETIRRGLYGLENLSLIPGLVGAAPIQNIGAYGVELSDRLVELTAVDRVSCEQHMLVASECDFGYRNSIFKRSLKDQKVITSITLELDSQFSPVLDYADLSSIFENRQKKVTARQVSDAVIGIRSKKLPDPKLIGNVGSFFKNVSVSLARLRQIQELHPGIIARIQDDGLYKLPVAALIEHLGLKGKSVGDACVSDQHALIIVNRGNAKPEDVTSLANLVIEEVKNRFDIELEIEPVIVN